MSKVSVFIDGENFIHKVEEVLKLEGVDRRKIDISKIHLRKLIEKALDKTIPDNITFYSAKLHEHPGSIKKSRELIASQRRFKASLEKQNIEFVIAGHVRGQLMGGKVLFREKGVDVRIAVDLIIGSCDHNISTAVICSSDSDLQPAVKESKNRGTQTVYLGFEINPNKGLMSTTHRSVIFRNAEILESLEIKSKK